MTSSDAQEQPPIRASDTERQAAVTVLHDALARGLLTVEECDERMTAAYAARFVRELPPLTADLPPAPAAAPAAPGWRALAVLAWLQVRAALSGVSWRGSAQTVRARPRLALAALALLAPALDRRGQHRPALRRRRTGLRRKAHRAHRARRPH